MMNFQFDCNASGQWELMLNGERHVGVVAIRAFPVAAPDEAISIVDDHGHELRSVRGLGRGHHRHMEAEPG